MKKNPRRRFPGMVSAPRGAGGQEAGCGSVGRRTEPAPSLRDVAVSGSMFAVMVQQRKLTRASCPISPDPSVRVRIANKGVSQEYVRFRAVLGVQNRAESCNIVQKPAKRCKKMTKNGGFSDPVFENIVKSASACQAVSEEGGRQKAVGRRQAGTYAEKKAKSLR